MHRTHTPTHAEIPAMQDRLGDEPLRGGAGLVERHAPREEDRDRRQSVHPVPCSVGRDTRGARDSQTV